MPDYSPRIVKIKGTWEDVVDDCRATQGKNELGHEPSEAFKKSILLAEHSPIRNISVKWKWIGMPHWVTVHWARHKWEKYITSQRSDKTGIPRSELPQDEPQNFTGEANAQHLIDTWRKRLCFKASPETRKYAEEFKKSLHDIEPEIADVLVPNCVYRCGCPEMETCGFWYTFVRKMQLEYQQLRDTKAASDIQFRYDLYNEQFYGK